jgi:hypothetical protein
MFRALIFHEVVGQAPQARKDEREELVFGFAVFLAPLLQQFSDVAGFFRHEVTPFAVCYYSAPGRHLMLADFAPMRR